MHKANFLTGLMIFALAAITCQQGEDGSRDGGNNIGADVGAGSGLDANESPGGSGLDANNSSTGGNGADDAMAGETRDASANGCRISSYTINSLPPDVIIVQDRSGSMQRDVNGIRTQELTRWKQLTGALAQVLDQTDKRIRWGMQMYPTCMATGVSFGCAPTPCTVEGLYRAPDLNQAVALNGMVTENEPPLDVGATPTAEAVRVATRALISLSTPNSKYLLIVTDGAPNCRNQEGGTTGPGISDENGAVAAVEAAVAAGFPVFLVGIATAGSSADMTLNRMATAGGRALPGNRKYYSANDEAELVAALNAIANQVRSCELELAAPAPGGDMTAVEIDGTRLLEGAQWTFGPGNETVVIHNVWCEKLRSGAVREVVIKIEDCTDAGVGPGKGVP